MHPTPAVAIEAARRVIREGGTVIGVGVGLLEDSLEWEASARAYAIWIRRTGPPSSIPCGAVRSG